MRNRLSILFILVIILPFVGVYGWLKFEKKAIQKSVKRLMIEGIPEDELVQFTFAKEDTANILNWIHGKEFEYRGEMYDIVNRYYSEDSVKYDLWWDHEETALNRKLARWTNQLINQSPAEQSKSNYLTFVLRSMFSADSKIVFQRPFFEEKNNIPIVGQASLIMDRNDKPIVPPPEIIHINFYS